MTSTDAIFVGCIVLAFCAFGAIIAWGYFQTKDLPRE